MKEINVSPLAALVRSTIPAEPEQYTVLQLLEARRDEISRRIDQQWDEYVAAHLNAGSNA